MSHTNWLARIADLNVYRAKHRRAPHKPLLLLVLLELADKGELPANVMWLTPELSFRFDTFWQVVAYRRTQPPDVRMPFHHLSGDGLWTPFTENGHRSEHRSLTRYVEFDPSFLAAVADPEFRGQARRILIAKYFEAAERNGSQFRIRRLQRRDPIRESRCWSTRYLRQELLPNLQVVRRRDFRYSPRWPDQRELQVDLFSTGWRTSFASLQAQCLEVTSAPFSFRSPPGMLAVPPAGTTMEGQETVAQRRSLEIDG